MIALSAGTIATCYAVTRVLLGAWCIISTLEWWAKRDMFAPDGLLPWRLLSLRSGWIVGEGRLRILIWERSTPWALVLRMGAAIVLVVTPSRVQACMAVLAIIGTSWLLTVRTWLAADGSDQLGQIVSVGLLLMAVGLAWGRTTLAFAGTLLVGGQLALAYFFGGVTKLASVYWRDGRALAGIVDTISYGHHGLSRFLHRYPRVARPLCWGVIAVETLFPVALLAGPAVLWLLLGIALLLHVSYAVFMGLNTFPWAFASAYPSFVVLNAVTHRSVGL